MPFLGVSSLNLGPLFGAAPFLFRGVRRAPLRLTDSTQSSRPDRLRGLWGSMFSRKDGPALSRPLRRGLFSRIELIAGSALAPETVCIPGLQLQVAELRGDWK